MMKMNHSFWRQHSVFVSGATGLLGSWLVEELLSRGANVTCLVRDWVAGSKLVRSGGLDRTNYVRGELEDYLLILRILNEYEVETVFHLGAQTIVGTSSRSPISTFESNIRGTWNILEACKNMAGSVKRVVVASSDKAYGVQAKLPYTEEAPLEGRFPYDVSKSCSDLIALSYYHSFDLPVAITRCGNLFGGGDINFNRLIPGTIRSIFNNEPPVIRSDGKYIRDYFYVRDAVKAYLMLAERLPEPGVTGEAFNFGFQTPLSVIEVVNQIAILMDSPATTPVILNQATNEIAAQYLDCRKARRILQWQPEYSFEQGMQETINWYRAYLSDQDNRIGK